MLDKSTILKFYKRRDIQEAIVQHAQQKEVGVRYGESFGKRPDVLSYPREVLDFALKNVTSFHCSEELWENPMVIRSEMSRKELDEQRLGWDLVLDIDCKILEYSKITADLTIRFLRYCEVQDFSVKFSGNKGFHIGVPFQAFPKQIGSQLTKDLFPEAARKIAFYITENIKAELGKRILALEQGNIAKIKEKVNLELNEILRYEINEYSDKIPKLNVDKFLEIDTILIASRHLYRMPYSLHEKSGLASIPLDPEKVMQFEKPDAYPDKIVPSSFIFLDRNAKQESARRLLIQALDFDAKKVKDKEYAEEKKENNKEKAYDEMVIKSPIKEEFFPPCVQHLLQGVEDGKKRGIFVLMNFLGKLGWNKEDIKSFIKRWNDEKNKDKGTLLRDVYLNGQLNTFTAGEKLPPNCNNDNYYQSLGLCKPNALCRHIKNPVNYTLLRWKDYLRNREEEEQKEAKEKAREERKKLKEEKDKAREEKRKVKEEEGEEKDKAREEKRKEKEEARKAKIEKKEQEEEKN